MIRCRIFIPGIINWSHAHYLPAVQVGPSQYTKFWEFQYVPGFVLCGNDAALLFPGLLALLAMLCVVYQLTHGFDVPERFCAAACWLVMGYVSFLWGSGHPSISSVKNDVISGVAYCTALLCVISLRKSVAASLPGYLVLFTCALLMLIGTKTTGLALTGVAVLAWACVVILRQGAMKPLARGGVIMLPPVIACLASPFYLTQMRRYHSPFYPVEFSVGKHILFAGPWHLQGTRLIDHLADNGFWSLFWQKHIEQIGVDFPIMLAVTFLLPCLVVLFVLWRKSLPARIPPEAASAQPPCLALFIISVAALLGWVQYFCCPSRILMPSGKILSSSAVRFVMLPAHYC